METERAHVVSEDRGTVVEPGDEAQAIPKSVGVFGGVALLYVALRSGDIFGVDGAHRCLHVYHHPGPLFHGSNHMLYPLYVLQWRYWHDLWSIQQAAVLASIFGFAFILIPAAL